MLAHQMQIEPHSQIKTESKITTDFQDQPANFVNNEGTVVWQLTHQIF